MFDFFTDLYSDFFIRIKTNDCCVKYNFNSVFFGLGEKLLADLETSYFSFVFF